jgi:hypothetical protein
VTWRERLKRVVSPPAEIGTRDTGLRFTDILFGFVIRELFLRLQHWSELLWYVRWQLIAATALVLGSWIGFRRSLNRSEYELKFFNIPLIRFVLDQIMIVFYFRVATLTPQDPNTHAPGPQSIAHTTAKSLLFIFALYAAWDALGVAMGYLRKYPKSRLDWWGAGITLAGLLGSAGLYFLMTFGHFGVHRAEIVLLVAVALLLAYRFAKEIRSSWRQPTDVHPT